MAGVEFEKELQAFLARGEDVSVRDVLAFAQNTQGKYIKELEYKVACLQNAVETAIECIDFSKCMGHDLLVVAIKAIAEDNKEALSLVRKELFKRENEAKENAAEMERMFNDQ